MKKKKSIQKVEILFECRECGSIVHYDALRKIMSNSWKTQLKCPKCKGAVRRVRVLKYYSGDAEVQSVERI